VSINPELLNVTNTSIGVDDQNVNLVSSPDRSRLLVQGNSTLLSSTDGGRTFTFLTTTADAGGVGLGWLRDGTILAAFSKNASIAVWRGYQTSSGDIVWSQPNPLPPFSPSHKFSEECAAARFVEDDDGTVFFIQCSYDAISPAERRVRAVVYASTDGGRMFAPRGSLMDWSAESDLISLGGGGTVLSFDHNCAREDALGSHACPLAPLASV